MQYGMHMGLLFYSVCTAQNKLKLEKEAEALAAKVVERSAPKCFGIDEKCINNLVLMRSASTKIIGVGENCINKLMVVRSASQMKRSAS